jgi:5-methylcytosine-specific restriction endonuclease McrA
MKISRKGIRTKLDKLVKEYVKKRDNYTCQKCGKKLSGSNCHGSHVIPVSAGLLWAYDPENIITLCYHDHINWWHKNPLKATEWFEDKFPKRNLYIKSMELVYKTRPIKTFELEEIYLKYKALI